MNWDEITSKKLAVEAAASECHENITQLREELNKGVSFGTAKTIIKGIWGDAPESKKLVSKLTVNFPKENASVISYAALPPFAINTLLAPTHNTVQYFVEVQEWIERSVVAILEKLNQCDYRNQLAVDALNEFRKNVLLYVEECTYSGSDIEAQQFADWAALAIKNYDYITDNGDYLTITDFVAPLKECHEKVVARRAKDFEHTGDYPSLSGTVYRARTCVGDIQVAYLFAEYLNKLSETVELVLE